MLRFWTELPPHVKQVLLPIHLAGAVAVCLLPWVSLGWLALSLLGWILFSGVGIAVGHHRYFSHRSFKASRWAEYLMAYCGVFGGQGSAIFWTALHRGYHHPHADTERDLHSPVHGRWSAYMGWMFKIKTSSVNLKYAVDLLRDPLHLFIHKHYSKIFWGVILGTGLISWHVALYLFVLPVLLAQHQENLVDLFCHSRSWFSYRNHATTDLSVNSPLLGLLGWGQGWHNNHHAAPSRASFGGERWFEFDPACLLIFLLRTRS